MSKHVISPLFKTKVPHINIQTIIGDLQNAELRVHNNYVCFFFSEHSYVLR